MCVYIFTLSFKGRKIERNETKIFSFHNYCEHLNYHQKYVFLSVYLICIISINTTEISIKLLIIYL